MGRSNSKTSVGNPVNRTTLNVLLVVLVLSIAGYGFYRLHRQVAQQLAFPTTPSKIVMKNVPAWMPQATSDAIARSVAPRVQRSALDSQLLHDIADLLAVNPWVKKVNQVRRLYGESAGDTIQIDCDYRAPAALVYNGREYFLIDSEGYRLPEQYAGPANPRVMYGEDGRIVLRVIDGVGAATPVTGRKWSGDDLQAGLDMVRLLFEQRCAQDIERINVANFNGRRTSREPQLTLRTRFNTEIRWGEPIGVKFHAELSPAQKLDRLSDIVTRYGRVDAGHSWLDIRLDKVMYPLEESTVVRND